MVTVLLKYIPSHLLPALSYIENKELLAEIAATEKVNDIILKLQNYSAW